MASNVKGMLLLDKPATASLLSVYLRGAQSPKLTISFPDTAADEEQDSSQKSAGPKLSERDMFLLRAQGRWGEVEAAEGDRGGQEAKGGDDL